MEKEEYYINKDSCSCSNSPYFLINNLFKELDTEKKKKIARLNLGINDDNIVDIENYMEIELKLPKGIYYYHNNPTISIVANLNSKVINPEILVGKNKNYLVFKYYINDNLNAYYACYLNNYFIKKWENENAPLEIKQIFNDNLATPTNNGLMSTEDKEKLDNLPDGSIVYTKKEINTLLSDKADNNNVYNKIETDNNFATKTELNKKANSSDVYTKKETNVILNTKANALEVYNRISDIEEIIGEGGSIDERIATAKSELIDGASEEGDTFKKIEDRLSDVEESVGEGGSVDERIAVETNRAQTAEADRYTKNETYSKEEVNALIPIPDNEDLTSVNVGGSNVLKFNDKVYNPLTYSGMGRKILRKNIVNGINTLTQSMVNQTNTIYVIQYDFTLGKDITVPANCVLEFDGGRLSNGTLIGTNTKIKADKTAIFTGITIAGTWNVPNIYSAWFSDITENNKIKNLVYLSNADIVNNIYIDEGTYNVSVSAEKESVLVIKDNTNVYNSGTIVLATNAFSYYNIVEIWADNVKWQGGYIRGDKDTHTGTEGEFGHGIALYRSNNVIIENINISYCWGDCISISQKGQDIVNKNIIIRNFTLTEGRRQGISVVAAENCLIENGTITDISGTAPQRCIDIEPNSSTNSHVKNIILRNLKCVNYNNIGVLLVQSADGACSDILIDRCYLEGSGTVVAIAITKNVTVVNSTILASSTSAAISISNSAEKIRILNNYIANSGVETEDSGRTGFIRVVNLVSKSSHVIYGNYIDTAFPYVFDVVSYEGRTIVSKNIITFTGSLNSENMRGVSLYDNLITGNIVKLRTNAIVCRNNIKCSFFITGSEDITLKNNTITANDIVSYLIGSSVCENNIVNLNLISEYDYFATTNLEFFYLKDDTSFRGNIIRISKDAEEINLPSEKQNSLIMSSENVVVSDNIIIDASDDSITDHSVFLHIFKNLAVTTSVNYINNTADSSLAITNVYYTFNSSVSTNYKWQDNEDIKQIFKGYKYFNKTLGIPLYAKSVNYDTNVVTWADAKGINMEGVTAIKGTTYTRNHMSLTTENAGLEYYDTTLGKFVYWNGTAWVDGTNVVAGTSTSGTFANKPTINSNNIPIGFKYFCTDRQTTEGATDGIEIIHKGNDVWVDALGRVIS